PASSEAEPPMTQLGPGVGVENELARRIEDAGHHDLALAPGGNLQGSGALHVRASSIACCVRASSPTPALRAAHPGAGSCPPRCGGIPPANRSPPPAA